MTTDPRRTPRRHSALRRPVTAALALVAAVPALAAAQATTAPSVPATIITAPSTTMPTTTAPAALPGAPQAVTASLSGTNQITVTWQPPAVTGGLPVQSYLVQSSPGDLAVSVTGSIQSATFFDLRPGTAYAFFVRAVTVAGTGAASPWTTPLPVPSPPAAPAPNPPHTVAATVTGARQVSVSWRPGDANASTVVAYRVVGVPGSPTQQVPAGSTSAVFDNLTPGVSYSFTVRAIAADGGQSSAVVANPVVVPVPVPAPVVSVPAALPLPGQVANPPGTPKPCVPYKWPAAVSGTPVNYRVGAPQGFFVYESGGYWYLRAYNPGRTAVILSGTVTANAKMTSTALGLEKTDLLRRATRSATFSFRSANDIDGIRFSLPCGTSLTFRLYVNGNLIAPTQIFVGRQAANPVTQPLVVVR